MDFISPWHTHASTCAAHKWISFHPGTHKHLRCSQNGFHFTQGDTQPQIGYDQPSQETGPCKPRALCDNQFPSPLPFLKEARLMTFGKLTFTVALLLTLSTLSHAGHWARFRGPNGTGVADKQNLPVQVSKDDGILWKVPIPGTGNASPVVWDQRLFIHGATPKERYLMCLDVTNGQTVWKKSIPGGPVRFRSESSLASSTPTTDGTMVYVSFWDGKDIQMVAYDFAGERKWGKNLGPFISQHGAGASPILYKDKVIFANDMDKEEFKTKVPVERPSILMAFNKTTGTLAWETPREAIRACYSAPIVLERDRQPDELIVTSTTAVTSYNPQDGKPNWEWRWSFAKMP